MQLLTESLGGTSAMQPEVVHHALRQPQPLQCLQTSLAHAIGSHEEDAALNALGLSLLWMAMYFLWKSACVHGCVHLICTRLSSF